MRKLSALLLAVLLVMTLVACGGGDKPVSSAPTSSAESSTPSMPESSSPEASESDISTSEPAASTPEKTDKPSSDVTTKTDGPSSTTTKTERPVTTTTKIPTTTAQPEKDYASFAAYAATKTKVTVAGSASDLSTYIYRLGQNGLMVRETVIDSGKGGTPVEIAQVSDIHFNKLNQKDFDEKNPSVMEMYEFRKPENMTAARESIRVAGFADQFVASGDTIDFLTWGAIEMVQEEIWKKYPTALVALGNHDIRRTWSHDGFVSDLTTKESRYEILKSSWKHDVSYTSRVLGNKVMVIQLDNAGCFFSTAQYDKLEADLATARKNGYAVLLFYHHPLATGDSADTAVPLKRIRSASRATTYNATKTEMLMSLAPTKKVVNLIKSSADVIKGAYCGHLHDDVYTEIHATTPDGKAAIIPQHILTSSWMEQGSIHVITVK